MSVAVIIVAAGRGTRLGGELPKQYIPLGDHCSLRRAVEAFLSVDAVRWLVPVIHVDDSELCADALTGSRDPRVLPPAMGGETRAQSVRLGLESLEIHKPDFVLIHDAARPFVPIGVICDVISALQHGDGACAALPIVDALWKSEDSAACEPVPRDGLWRAQTPQGFWFRRILDAHRRHDGSGADDVAVAREAGLEVKLVLGSERNYKITTTADLERALWDAQVFDAQTEQMARKLVEPPR